MLSPLDICGYEKLSVIVVMVFEDGDWGEHLDPSEEKVIREREKFHSAFHYLYHNIMLRINKHKKTMW